MTQSTRELSRGGASSESTTTRERGPLKLLDVSEPLFQYICRLNRSARKGGDHEQSQVRHEIMTILTEIKQKAQADATLTSHFHRQQGNLMLVLIFFVDFMIRNSALRFAGDWVNLADAEREFAGDEKFFDMLDKTLADKSEAGTERLAIYYACLGLGFTGFYTGQPEFLRRKMLECSSRLRRRTGDESGRICPDAYQNVDGTDLNASPGTTLIGWAISLAVLVVVLLVVNAYLYYRSSADLAGALDRINKAKSPPAAVVPADGAAGGR